MSLAKRGIRPRWVAKDHELWLDNNLIKRFNRPAPVAELLLAAFEEQGWPKHIDDPLPPRLGISEKRRLRCAVENLNRRLNLPDIQFAMHGRGLGVSWRLSGDV